MKARGLDSTSNTDPPQGSRTHPRQVEELRVDFVRSDQTQRTVKNDCVKDGPQNLWQLMRAESQIARWRELDNLAAAHGSDASSASMNMVFMGDGKIEIGVPSCLAGGAILSRPEHRLEGGLRIANRIGSPGDRSTRGGGKWVT